MTSYPDVSSCFRKLTAAQPLPSTTTFFFFGCPDTGFSEAVLGCSLPCFSSFSLADVARGRARRAAALHARAKTSEDPLHCASKFRQPLNQHSYSLVDSSESSFMFSSA